MYRKTESPTFFSPEYDSKVIEDHLVIPTSVDHHYENCLGKKAVRNALYIKTYGSNDWEQKPIVFFHGGPNIVNEEQFSIMQQYFNQRRHKVYIPEIEGSAMYSGNDDLPKGFKAEYIPAGLTLLGLNQLGGGSGLNEFTKNYADDIKDVLEEVARRHPNHKINVIAHSLGGHHFLAALQHYPHLAEKAAVICNVAGTVDVGANRFNSTLKQCADSRGRFYPMLANQSTSFIKSDANVNQPGPTVDEHTNPSANLEMNHKMSVLYNNTQHFPPILLLHALDDPFVFFQGSLLMQQKIESQGGLVQGLYFSTGGHGFIKNEGNIDIRTQALENIKEFFQNPDKKITCDLSQFHYDDIHGLHQEFLANKEAFLDKRYAPTSQFQP